MKDNMEQFIRENRAAFDDLEPSSHVWEHIDRSLPVKRGARIIRWQRFAVAASILLLVGLVGFFSFQQGKQQGVAITLAEISPELGEAEAYYQSEINNKMALLASLAPDHEVTHDLKEAESFLQELKTELKDVSPGEREIVIQAMIENYRTRLDILERVLDRLPGNSLPTKSSDNETKNI